MAMSIQGFVVRVGRKLNRSPDEVQPFVDLLLDNWYDSPDTLADVSADDLAKLGLPLRFAKELIAASSEQGSRGGGRGGSNDRSEDKKGREKGKDKGKEKGDRFDRSSKGKGKDSGKDNKGKAKGKDKGSKGKSRDKDDRYSGGRDKDIDSDAEFQEALSLEDAAAMRPEFGLRAKILGQSGRNVKHIETATGTRVSLQGGPTEDGEDTGEPMRLIVTGNDEKEYNRALEMIHDLLDTIFEDYNVWAAKKGYETFEVAEEADESQGGKSEGRRGSKGKGKKGKGKGEGKGKGKGRSGEPPHKRART